MFMVNFTNQLLLQVFKQRYEKTVTITIEKQICTPDPAPMTKRDS